jgi:uncharacterized membrane protein
MSEIFVLPNPLHPALVHFPIVLLLLGAIVAVGAAVLRRWNLPLTAAILLGAGAIGSIVAVQTGEREGELVEGTPALETALDQHESWAERTRLVGTAAALFAAAAVATSRWRLAARGLGLATAATALAAGFCVAATGHYGGQLVYRHGAGVNPAPTAPASAITDQPPAIGAVPRQDHDD